MENNLNTEKFNNLLAIPSLVVILVTLAILFSGRKRILLLENIYISSFLVSLCLMNLLQVIAFGNISNNFDALTRTYYFFVIVMISSFVCLGDRLTEHPNITRNYLHTYIFISGIFLISFVIGSDLFIEGGIKSTYTVLRLPGDYYWSFLTYLFLCILFGVSLIIKSIKNANNPLDKRRHIVILYSLAPLILTLTFVFIMIQIGASINLSFLLPISTLIFLLVYLFTESRQDLFFILVNIPFSKERKAYKELNQRVMEFISKTQTDEIISLKELLAEIEKVFITNALEIKDGDHNLAAEMLSISISTVYRNKEREVKNSGI